MAWSWTSPVTPVSLADNVDPGEKVTLPAVPVGQAAWWLDYAVAMRQEFARRVQQYSLNVTNLQVTALGMDNNGVGSLTLTFVTS